MRLQSMSLAGFRCFGSNPHTIEFGSDLLAIVGPNASGKTTVLQALCKLFGVTRAQRTVRRSDFHLPHDVPPDDRTTRAMFIDVIIALPELAKGPATAHTVAPAFKHMQLAGPGTTPVCRMRLEAQWEDDGTAEGEVTQNLYWVDKLDEKITDADRRVVAPLDRGNIQVYYTPAARDAQAQIRASTGALAARLLRAIEWSAKTKGTVESATKTLSVAFGGEAAIKAISSALSERWKELHDEKTDTDPALTLTSQRFEEVIARIQVLFNKGPASIQRGLDALSDGQQSLFYFALAAAVFDLEKDAVAGKIKGFRTDDLRIPALSIFAMEEPENHLSPYYLSRIVSQTRSIIGGNTAQAIITSHSPAVLSRVDPTEVRYCRCDEKTRLTTVKTVTLPEKDEEAIKFVRGAMLAFPELYFARFVLLVEGDSERLVLPKLAEADGFLFDPSFVAIAPLGGRHVQHFWRLLKGLDIPFATLLDLDLGREGGGFGRIKTALGYLIENGADRTELLKLDNGSVLTPAEFEEMHEWDAYESLPGWIEFIASYGVYFSTPLDLDMAMLKAYPDAYKAAIPKGGGPKMTPENAAKVVLGENGPGLDAYKTVYPGYDAHMPAYRYHFLTHSKPATHLRAFAHLDEEKLETAMPETYRNLLNHISDNLKRD
ncbi:ATP-dependent endonuclease [Bradyrhizobium sp. SRS-191]|uniref:ATP-dependent nuclease n=1 Tax=Bradyrhizobium sp. SRS-191 TaxID=2962606 RepID=UPI00211E5111|nr:AAA family ATPase [Bradyrhizobium sp. SRS-191]